MTWDPSRFVSFDCETWKVQPGLLAPPLVCASIAVQQSGQRALLDADRAGTMFEDILDNPRVTVVGANIAFDMLVMAHDARQRGVNLLPAIFDAYRAGRVFDIQIAEALHAVAEGHLGKDPFGQMLRNSDGKVTGKYSLHACVELVLGRSNAKVNDRWRQSYALLKDVPIEEWPTGARTYPVDDAVNTLEVAVAQVARNRNLGMVAEQCYKAFALHLRAAWGIRTDPAAVEILAQAAQAGRDAGRPEFERVGFLRADGSEDQAVLKKAVALAYGCDGECGVCSGTGKVPSPADKRTVKCDVCGGKGAHTGCVLCNDTGRVPHPKPKLINCIDCSATGLDLDSAPVPRTEPSNKFPKGQVQNGRDTLIESGDELLGNYGAFQEDDKILDSYVPYLQQGAHAPITLRPNSVLETLRISYDGLIQTLPRQVSARLGLMLKLLNGPLGVRDCFVARPGKVFYSVDYSGGELVTFAESCVNRVGFSEMGKALNAGADVHALLGARLAGIKPEDFNKKIHKAYRQAAKPANFGFPGGMGALKMVLQQRKQGPDTPWPGGHTDLGGGVMGYKGLRFCVLLGRAPFCGLEKVTSWGRPGYERPCPPTCRDCIETAQEIRDEWFKTWPEAKPYLDWHAKNVDAHGEVTQPYTGYVRGGVDFCSAANGDFQSLLAVISGRALCRVGYEQYVDESSPLFGSRGIVGLHDEDFGECDEAKGHEVCERIVDIMVDEFQKGCPKHKSACKAEPTTMARWWKAAEAKYENGRLVPWSPA